MAESPSSSPTLPLAALSFMLALAGYVDAVGYLRFQGLLVLLLSGWLRAQFVFFTDYLTHVITNRYPDYYNNTSIDHYL